MSAEALIARAKSLREQKNAAAAILVAREATGIDPENAAAWWQLGLATQAHQGAEKALDAFEKTMELAPHFGSGWHFLGLAQAQVGKLEEAKSSFRLAYEFDGDLTTALDQLAEVAKQTDDKKAELWALEQLEGADDLSGWQCNRLGTLHHKNCAYARAITYYRQCAELENDAAGWINLGLVLSEPAVSQDADAVDALRHGQRKYPDEMRFQKMLDGLLPRLLALGDEVCSRDRGLLAADEQYRHYINPIELLGLGEDDLDELGAKEIQRAKRRLLQEIALEDGKISWVDGLVVRL